MFRVRFRTRRDLGAGMSGHNSECSRVNPKILLTDLCFLHRGSEGRDANNSLPSAAPSVGTEHTLLLINQLAGGDFFYLQEETIFPVAF